MKSPKYSINDVVKIRDMYDCIAVAIITEIRVTARGICYLARIGFETTATIYDNDEYEFEEYYEAEYTIIGKIGNLNYAFSM